MNVNQLRKLMKLTQEEFARKIHVTVTTISRWETGFSEPSKLAEEKLDRLAKKYRKLLDDFKL